MSHPTLALTPNTVRQLLRFALFGAATLSATQLYAQTVTTQTEEATEQAASVSQLNNIVVTATGSDIDIKDAPASISVITREEIERKPVSSLAEILSTLPGVTGGYASTGAQSKIKLRGMPEQYTLILVDGKRQGSSAHTNYRPDLGQQDLDWITPEMIERIEVVRGPMSSLYGSDAMGGVINIITRKTSKVWTGSASSDYSKPDTSNRGDEFKLGVNLSGPISERFGLRVGGSVSRRSSDDIPGGSSGSRKQNANVLVNWDITDNQSISIEAAQGIQRSLGSSQLNDKGNPIVSAWGSEKMVHTFYGLSHNGTYGQYSSKLNLYHNKYENKGSSIGSNSNETVLDGSFDLPYTLGVDSLLTTGFQWKREELDNADTIGTLPNSSGSTADNSTKLSRNNWSVFAENQSYLRDDLTLTLGLRMDHDSKFGSHWSPRSYLVYHPTSNWTVKGGVSKGFRAPNLKESSPNAATQSRGNGCNGLTGMGYPNNPPNINGASGCYMIGNADLKPETSTNYELNVGYDYEGWAAEATYFHTDFKNKIDYQPLGYVNGYWMTRMENAQKARTRGLEASVRLPILSTLSWNTNLTRMFESKNLSTGADLLVVPKLTVNSNINWRITEKWSTNFSAQYIGKQLTMPDPGARGGPTFAGGYTTYDWTTHYNVSKDLTLRAGVLNLTGKSTLDGDNSYDNGDRVYFVGLTTRF
ncbi:TonB-dependent receptor domain-containing protein [Paenalcaligenes sp. Me131]|uniref:TonB-dependent receptor domain-containing protein n=1 Tax=Paenalcaligenes sp. Me131 TaxID=3392636 RepID=UPI003D29DDA3